VEGPQIPPAAVICFEETRQTFAKPQARYHLYECLDWWLASLEAHMPDETPGLEDLTQAVFAMRQASTGGITEPLVKQQHVRVLHRRTMRWPHCQRIMPACPAPPHKESSCQTAEPPSISAHTTMPACQALWG
jgi:hypothetical protein